jgi:hypothetical protein
MKALASYIMRGPLQAAMFVSATAILSLILPLVNYLSGAALALVTLRRGINAGLLILASSILVFGLFVFFVLKAPGLIDVFGFVILSILVWVLAGLLRHSRSLPNTLLVAAGFGFAFVLIIYAVTDPASLWQKGLTQFFTPMLEKADEQTKTTLTAFIAETSRYMTGFLGAAIVLNCAICLFLGRWWQALLYNPGGFQQEFHALKFTQAFAIATAVMGISSYIPLAKIGTIAADLFSVALTVYFLQTLAVAHAVVHKQKLNRGWLIPLYVLSPLLWKIIAIVGYIDTWANFRDKHRGTITKD